MRRPQTYQELKQRIYKPKPQPQLLRKATLEHKPKQMVETKFEDGSVSRRFKTKDYKVPPRGHRKKVKAQIA